MADPDSHLLLPVLIAPEGALLPHQLVVEAEIHAVPLEFIDTFTDFEIIENLSSPAPEFGLCHVSDELYWDLRVGRSRPMVAISSNGKQSTAIIDTGAKTTAFGSFAAEMMDAGCSVLTEVTSTRFGMANHTIETGGGVLDLEMSLDDVELVRFPVHYIPSLGSFNLIGMNFIEYFGMDIDLINDRWRFGDGEWHSLQREPENRPASDLFALYKLTESETQQLERFLAYQRSLTPSGLDLTQAVEHHIKLKAHQPVKQRVYHDLQ